MRALLFDGKPRLLDGVPLPQRAPGEALIRVRTAGICNTDLEVARGYADYHGVMGHEFVGQVAAADDTAWVGQRVVGEINCACATCTTCREGQPAHCPNRTVLGIAGRQGCFADYLVLPEGNLHAVPAAIPDEVAVFVEPLAAALRITEQVHVRPSDRVLVLGDGKLALLIAQTLALVGCEVLLLGRHSEKLEVARSLGIHAELSAEYHGPKANLVVEATGAPTGLALAKTVVRPTGMIVCKSTFAEALTFPASAYVVDEVTVLGSRCGPFPAALRLLERGQVRTQPLIGAVYPFEVAEDAFAAALQPSAIKILLRMSQSDS